MGRSILLDGVLSEDAESARAYVWAYDHATVGGEIGRRFLRSEKAAPDTGDRHSQSDGLVAPMEPDDWRAAKLARIFQHLDLQFAGAPAEAELIDLCLQAESKAVDLLVKLESSIKPTEGASTSSAARRSISRGMSCARCSSNLMRALNRNPSKRGSGSQPTSCSGFQSSPRMCANGSGSKLAWQISRRTR